MVVVHDIAHCHIRIGEIDDAVAVRVSILDVADLRFAAAKATLPGHQ
jgi:hypothetical protein